MIKYIENSKNYFVTDKGEVYSGHKPLKISDSGSGYAKVRIRYLDGTQKDELIHRLVAKAFIPNPENKPLVNHIDYDRKNNNISNLEWVTYSENNIHSNKRKYENGSFYENNNSVYSEAQIRSVFEKLQEGWTIKDIEDVTGVDYQNIVNIRSCHRHKEIAKEYKMPPLRSRRISLKTVRWICHKIDEGFTDKEIFEMYTGEFLNKQKIRMIRWGHSWTEISKDFKFFEKLNK